ncbi:MAG: asparaginase [Acidobacteria bacterium]|nr:asparaginase [Acidobacteriota bacterium]
MSAHRDRPRLAVISLGGTIASTGADASAGVTPRLSGEDLVQAAPQLREIADIETVEFRKVPSGDLTLSDVVALAHEIEGLFDDGIDGVVVTQGTDTMEETSFALDVLVRSTRPVVFTGAMRNPTTLGADGLSNLVASARVAASSDAVGLGTLVVFNDEVHAARFVRKSHTSSTATFQSPNCGPLGWIIEDRVRVVARVSRLGYIGDVVAGEMPDVALLTMTLGDDARLVSRVRDAGYAGAVIEGFGGGHVPARTVPAIAELASQMPVVLASRATSGELLESTYGFAGSERDLLSRGLVSAGSLDALKARVLLSLVAATTDTHDDVVATFRCVVDSLWTFSSGDER